MPIMFRCEYCNAKIKVPEDKAGMNGKCPKCGKLVPVPLASDTEFKNYENRDRKLLTPSDDPESDFATKDTKNMMTFDRTELLHLPESIEDKVSNAKRKSTRKMNLDDFNTDDDDDMLYLDDESAEMPLEAGNVGFVQDDDVKLADDYFKLLDEEESSFKDQSEDLVVRDTRIHSRKEKPIQIDAPKQIAKAAPMPIPRQVQKGSQRPQSAPPRVQRKQRPERPERENVEKNVKSGEEPVKKRKGGCVLAIFGFLFIIAIIAAVFVFSSWLMLKRVENGKSPADSAYKIMKFDERLKEIDKKMNDEKNNSQNSESENTAD